MVMSIKDYFNNEVDFKKIIPKLNQYISAFVSRNNDFFSSNGLDFCPTFGEDMRRDFLNVTGLDVDEYFMFSRQNAVLKTGFINVNDPVNLICLLASEFGGKTNKMIRVFLMFKLYTSKYNKYFKYGVDAGTMGYLYNNILTRQTMVVGKTIMETFNQMLDTADKLFANKLKRLNDQDILDYINSLVTRINEMLKKIANKYYETDGRIKVEKDIVAEDILITTSSDTDRLTQVIRNFKQTESYGVNKEIYNLCDTKGVFRGEFVEGHDKALDTLYGIADEMIDLNTKMEKGSIKNFKTSFSHNAFRGKLKSKDLTDMIDTYAEASGVKTNQRRAYRDVVYRYVSLRIYKILLMEV